MQNPISNSTGQEKEEVACFILLYFIFAFGGWGVNFSHQTHAVGLGFVEKKILRILAGTARIMVTWFSQYSCLKVQNFAIIGQL
jgi:hypothetical protein